MYVIVEKVPPHLYKLRGINALQIISRILQVHPQGLEEGRSDMERDNRFPKTTELRLVKFAQGSPFFEADL